jgi:hypothetical protein
MPIIARFDTAHLCSDGGLLALREVEKRLGIAQRLAACIDDPRAPEKVTHGLDEIIRFRMLMIAAGYEDGNDADALRADPMFKLAMERLAGDGDLCSQPTISRAENLPDARALLRMGQAPAFAMQEHRCRGKGSLTIVRAFVGCRGASCSTSTTPSMPCMAASSFGRSMRTTTNTGSSRSWCSMVKAGSRYASEQAMPCRFRACVNAADRA